MSNKTTKNFLIALGAISIFIVLYFFISNNNDNKPNEAATEAPKKDTRVIEDGGYDRYGNKVIIIDGEESIFLEG